MVNSATFRNTKRDFINSMTKASAVNVCLKTFICIKLFSISKLMWTDTVL